MEEIFNDALKNRTDKIYEYLQFGDINIVDPESGMSLLHFACLGGSLEVASILINKKITLDIVDKTGQTAIFIAVRNKLLTITRLLVNAGARLNLVNNRGESLLSLAVLNGSNAIVDLLMENNDFDLTISNINRENVLFYAIKGRKEELFIKIAKANPELIHAKDFHNTNLLQLSLKYNTSSVFHYLKDKISIYEVDNANNNACFYLAKYSNNMIVTDFLKLRPIIEGANNEGQTVLSAAEENTYDVLHQLEEYRESYDYIAYLRTYPLHVAVINRDYHILQSYKVDPNKKDVAGNTILELAKIINDKNILNILNI